MRLTPGSSHVLHRFWSVLHKRLLTESPPKVLRLSLRLPVRLEHDSSFIDTVALIDTGCSFPVVLKDSLFPAHDLRRWKTPLTFYDASGHPMSGGEFCVYLRVHLPVASDSQRGAYFWRYPRVSGL